MTGYMIVDKLMGAKKYAKLLSSFGYQLLPETVSNKAPSIS